MTRECEETNPGANLEWFHDPQSRRLCIPKARGTHPGIELGGDDLRSGAGGRRRELQRM